jgi:hypothetical protein
VDWLAVTALGAVGGALVEVVNLYGRMTGWQSARHAARARGESDLPGLSSYIDVPADSLVALTRLLLGAAAGLVFHTQVSGAAAAVAVGACAPALLRQVGSSRSIAELLQTAGNDSNGTVPPGETPTTRTGNQSPPPVTREETVE